MLIYQVICEKRQRIALPWAEMRPTLVHSCHSELRAIPVEEHLPGLHDGLRSRILDGGIAEYPDDVEAWSRRTMRPSMSMSRPRRRASPRLRYSNLEHTWLFNVQAGTSVSFNVTGRRRLLLP
jgi:hypothetical protein